MGHETTDKIHVDMMMERSKAHGFNPFRVKAGSMGFIYNRYVPEPNCIFKQ
jgi:hypothetical protein